MTVLTIKFAEEVSEYLLGMGIKAHYLHSEIDTLERSEIIKALRLGHIDVIVGINLLREGLDIPEVSLVAIFDAGAQGFLRNERSLLQTIGRAARNSNGIVILYSDNISPAMEGAITQTLERRKRQQNYNHKHGITPTTIRKSLPTLGEESSDLMAGVAGRGVNGGKRLVAKKQGSKDIGSFVRKFDLGTGSWSSSDSVLDLISQPEYDVFDSMDDSQDSGHSDSDRIISRLESEMRAAASRLDFERAAVIRDRITELREATN